MSFWWNNGALLLKDDRVSLKFGDSSAGCCCEPPFCTYFSDTFDRWEDTTDLGPDWTEVAGDWSTKLIGLSNSWLVVSSSNARVDCNTTNPLSSNKLIVQVTMQALAVGDQLRILVDNGNYVVEYEKGASASTTKLRIYNGATLLVSLDDTTGGNSTITVCLNGSQIIAYMAPSGFGDPLSIYADCVPTSSICSLATGTVAGEARFDAFSIQYHKDDVPTCSNCRMCNACIVLPDEWEAVIDNSAPSGCPPSGTYVLTPLFNCIWKWSNASSHIILLLNGSGTFTVFIGPGSDSSFVDSEYEGSLTGIDCPDVVDLLMTLISNYGYPITCITSSTTCTISAL